MVSRGKDLPLVVITGPTASGKTGLAIDLAEKFGGEIICADSRTIYRGMDIGTAKPTLDEQSRVPHHGLDLVDPGEYFSAAQFKQYADQKIKEIRSRGKIPFLVGGTGLYIDSVIFDFDFTTQADWELRTKLAEKSVEELQKYCRNNNIDLPENLQNRRHLINAIERQKLQQPQNQQLKTGVIVVGIATKKEILNSRIEQRSEQLFLDNVVNEAIKLGKNYGWRSEAMTGNVYPLVEKFSRGEIDNDELRRLFVLSDKRLAKRQMTWLRRNPHIIWADLVSAEQHISQLLAEKNNS